LVCIICLMRRLGRGERDDHDCLLDSVCFDDWRNMGNVRPVLPTIRGADSDRPDRGGCGERGLRLAAFAREVKMERSVSIYFFAGGNTAVFDDKDQQIPELQKSWFLLFVEFLQTKGIKVEDIQEVRLPNGKHAEYLKEHHNWRIK